MRRIMGAAVIGIVLSWVGGLLAAEPANHSDVPAGTIAFASLGPRAWDVYVRPTAIGSPAQRLTDNPALDYNAAFSPDGKQIAFVSERDGNMEIYSMHADGTGLRRLTDNFALDDHPRWSPDGKRIVFTSTREPNTTPGQAWNAVYVMDADGANVTRLTPAGVADYSPAWAPSGAQIVVASGSGKTGGTDLYLMNVDGTERRLVEKNAGWPAFSSDGKSLYFHSRRQNRWGVWRVAVDGTGLERVSPTVVEAYTPATSADGKLLVAAIKRGNVRQIEVLDLASAQWTPITTDSVDHWNPQISASGQQIVYHQATPNSPVPNVERWGAPPATQVKPTRLAGSFPSFSPDYARLCLLGDGFAGLDVMNVDGTDRKTLYTGKNRGMFSTTWSHGDEEIGFAVGGVFEQPSTDVELMGIRPDGAGLHKLVEQTGNNGFPSFSPDGKQFVFRGGKEGFKNLYIANRDGTGARQLTQGRWTDTMCDWSHDGRWIVFASDRESDFEVWLIRPDGSNLHKLIGGGGRNNHPHFSPDDQWIVFTSQRAGFSAEEISLPNQPQPYGDLFIVRPDGTGLTRLTHNGFEEGTPAWGK